MVVRNSSRSESLHYYRYLSIIILFIITGTISSDIYNTILSHSVDLVQRASATSINYGISQQPITDISQLMPKLCQTQSTICEGSFCIPGVKKCVCDLRMPVLISRFCLRQIDMDTKCFATNQCNHTVKDAVCLDINSRAVLDAESTKFKLEQWHQLHELKKSSQSTLAKETSNAQSQMNKNREYIRSRNANFHSDDGQQIGQLRASAQNSVIPSYASARNSPYEINYDTPELLHQNHTRRRTNNNNDRTEFETFMNMTGAQGRSGSTSDSQSTISQLTTSATTLPQTSTQDGSSTALSYSTTSTTTTTTSQTIIDTSINKEATSTTYSDAINRKKVTVKTTHWPPGICSCPIGFMFDHMLRKCLALSLADSHCLVDLDCKQISSSHCSLTSRKCECDEPFVWDQQELACTRPKQPVRTEGTTYAGGSDEKRESASFVDNLVPPLVLAKLMPDYTMMLAIFVVLVIIGTLLLLKVTVKCFSSSSSALISPSKKKKSNQNNSNLPARSPYATLRRPDHTPQLSNFTQATRGRILNYDFEQESPRADGLSPSSAMPGSATLRPSRADRGAANEASARQYSATLRTTPRSHKHHHGKDDRVKSTPKSVKKEESIDDGPLELNDNISLSQFESEGKSESSNIVIPAPPPTQQPPYMLKNPMRGQSSAIAAAAAAVANKRLQKKNLDQQQQQHPSNGRITSESPVFL